MLPNAYVLLDFVTGHRGLFSYRFRGAAVRHGQYLGGHLCHVNNRFHPRVRLLLCLAAAVLIGGAFANARTNTEQPDQINPITNVFAVLSP